MADKQERDFLKGLKSTQPPAFILGNGTPHTLGFVRSFARRGIPVVAVSAESGARVWSRYCRLNPVVDSESTLLAFLERVGARMPCKGVILATGDAEVLFLSRNRGKLSHHFEFILPEAQTLERLANKKTQYEYAASIGVPIPRTCAPTSQKDLRRFAEAVGYPCVIKPAYSYLWRQQAGVRRWPKAAHVETPEELTSTFDQMAASGVELLVQERIDGSDSRLYGAYIYLDRDSEPLAAVVTRKHRQWPPVYGSGSYVVSSRQDDVLAVSLKLLKECGYRGLVYLEFKHDPKDGNFKLIELNVRSANPIAMILASGVDLPYIAYRDILREPVAPVMNYRAGVAWINLVGDLAAFAYYHRTEGLSLWQWVRSALLAQSHAYFAYDDPLPFLVHLCRTVKRVPSYLYSQGGNH